MSTITESAGNLLIRVVRLLTTFQGPFAKLSALCSLALALWTFARDLFRELLARLDLIAVQATGNADFSPLSFANYLFPVDEFCVHLTVLCVLTLVTALIRIIKSFIPTLAS